MKREQLSTLVCGLIVVGVFLWGTWHKVESISLDADLKEARVRLELAHHPQAQPAPIRPTKHCKDRPFIAMQADGGHWTAHCTPSADIKV